MTASPVFFAIIGCEVGFWILVIAVLCLRYICRAPRLSTGILYCVPVLDLLLLVVVAIDVAGGAEISTVHRLAGVYLGVTVAFGHVLIRTADGWFAHWYRGEPRPPKAPRGGSAALRHEILLFGRWLVAAFVASTAVVFLAFAVADRQQVGQLLLTFRALGVITVIWLLTGPVWALFSGADDRDDSRAPMIRDRRDGR